MTPEQERLVQGMLWLPEPMTLSDNERAALAAVLADARKWREHEGTCQYSRGWDDHVRAVESYAAPIRSEAERAEAGREPDDTPPSQPELSNATLVKCMLDCAADPELRPTDATFRQIAAVLSSVDKCNCGARHSGAWACPEHGGVDGSHL
jgi:hypothetical protein